MSERCIPCEAQAQASKNLLLEKKIAEAKRYAKIKGFKKIILYKTKNGYGYDEYGADIGGKAILQVIFVA
jgi:hypothetical protein